MNYKYLTIVGITAISSLTMGCSDDEHEYRSEPPLFSDVVVKSLETGKEEIHVGERFIVTAVQQKTGRLLNKTTYKWASTPDGISHKYKTAVIYDLEYENPTDTLIAQKPGTFNINFNAKYNVSGNTSEWSNKYGTSFVSPFESGNGKATYVTGGLFYFTVSAEKTINVLP